MESDKEGMRLRRQALRPIQTKSRKKDGEEMQEEEEEEPVSPAGMFFNEPNFNVHVVAIIGSKSKIDLDVFKDKLPHTLLKHPRFSSLLVIEEKDGGKVTKWVRTKVDLDKHIIVADIDSNNMESPDKFVEDYVYNLTKTSLDKSKPMWDLHVLHVKTSNAESVGIFRIHHSLGDGISLMSLILACARQIDNPQALPTLPTKKNQDNKAINPGFITRYSQCFNGFWWLLQLLWNTIVDVFLFMATAFFFKDAQTPIRGPPGCEYNPRRIVFRIVSLDDFKLVKNAMNLTINDVALGITQAGLSRYLNRRYGEINRKDGQSTEFKTSLPKKIRVRGNILVNIRPNPGIQALADMMEKNSEAKWGNWLGYVLFPFTIALKDDPLDYIRQAKATIDRKKHSLEALCTFSISGLLFSLFGVKSTAALLHRILSGTTMAFSNVVGPAEEIGFYNHPMTFLAATTYGQPHELMVNFQSYVNKMTIVLSVDETTISDPHRLCDDIAESLELIKDAVIERGLVNHVESHH